MHTKHKIERKGRNCTLFGSFHVFSKRLFAFSLIELLISLIAISCITAAFAPVISKKLMSNSISIGSTLKGNSGGGISDDCTDISPNCQTCIGDTCLGCNTSAFECGERQYKSNLSCACINCPDYDPNCLKCDNSGCTKCPEGYYVKNGKCLNCIEGYYCPNGTELEKCPKGYQCPTSNLTNPIGCSAQTYQANEGATSCNACESNQYSPAKQASCTNCADDSEGFNQGCTTCTTSGCTGVESGYYIKSNHSYPITNIQNCASGNSTGCTQCSSGYYLKDGLNCLTCSNIAHCTACDHNANSCTGCTGHHVVSDGHCSLLSCGANQWLSGTSCMGCSTISGCSTCSSGSVCTQCSNGHYLASGRCRSCNIAHCFNCLNTSSCTQCQGGYLLHNSKCKSRVTACMDTRDFNDYNCKLYNILLQVRFWTGCGDSRWDATTCCFSFGGCIHVSWFGYYNGSCPPGDKRVTGWVFTGYVNHTSTFCEGP